MNENKCEPSRDRTSWFVALQGRLVLFQYTSSTLLVRLRNSDKSDTVLTIKVTLGCNFLLIYKDIIEIWQTLTFSANSAILRAENSLIYG